MILIALYLVQFEQEQNYKKNNSVVLYYRTTLAYFYLVELDNIETEILILMMTILHCYQTVKSMIRKLRQNVK